MPRPTRVAHVLAKELREAGRDRNLIIHLVLVPLFLYPALGFLAFQVILVMRGMSEREVLGIAVDSRAPAALVDSLSARGVNLLPFPDELRKSGGEGAAAAFRSARASTLESALLWEEEPLILFDRSRERSTAARDEIAEAVREWKRERILGALVEVGLEERDLEVWHVEEENTASAPERGRHLLAAALPLVLLVMLAQGVFYGSLDTVVGERERGTLETILSSPLTPGETMLGKFLFVVVAGLLALALNFASLSLFLGFLIRILDVGVDIQVSVEPASIGLILLTAALTGGLMAAVLMMLSAAARTYREGQAVLTPVYLLILVPALIVTLKRTPFGMEQALVPVLNSVALFRAALSGERPGGPVAVTILVLLVSTAAALWAASRLVAREDLRFGPAPTLRRLLTGRGARR